MEMDRDDSDGSSYEISMEEDDGGGNDSGGWRSRSAPPVSGEGLPPESDTEGEWFDIGLAAAHSYLHTGMVSVRGRSVLEAGWQGRVPAVAHHGCVFPGETVPMVLPDPADAAILAQTIKKDRLFGLLCPDESGSEISGYGVLCEVYEMGVNRHDDNPTSYKARANHRFRLVNMPKLSVGIAAFSRLHFVEVRVLPEVDACDTLRSARIDSLDGARAPRYIEAERALRPRERARQVRGAEAALTPWPLFLHDMFDYQLMRNKLKEYFSGIMMDKLPHEPVSLSFWVASNMVLSARDRLALFVVDSALLRLHMECRLLAAKNVLCCSSCLTELAREESIFPMSSEGVHSNYVNLGGYMHDLVTVRAARNVALSGFPTAEYSWFPGYTWTVATCASCRAHVGWRFVAQTRTLRPQQFYGLCRNFVQPCSRQCHPGQRATNIGEEGATAPTQALIP